MDKHNDIVRKFDADTQGLEAAAVDGGSIPNKLSDVGMLGIDPQKGHGDGAPRKRGPDAARGLFARSQQGNGAAASPASGGRGDGALELAHGRRLGRRRLALRDDAHGGGRRRRAPVAQQVDALVVAAAHARQGEAETRQRGRGRVFVVGAAVDGGGGCQSGARGVGEERG